MRTVCPAKAAEVVWSSQDVDSGGAAVCDCEKVASVASSVPDVLRTSIKSRS